MDKNCISVPLFEENKQGDDINLINSIFYVQGKNIIKDGCTIKFIMSKEAMIGFGTNLLRIADCTDYDYSHHWHVDPLNNPKGNQTLGFFLTSDSPSFILMYNYDVCSYSEKNFELLEKTNIVGFNFYYDVPLEVGEKSYDEYEIGFSNIMRIVVLDEYMKDVTEQCVNVIFHLNRKGLEQMARFLLRYAHESSVVGLVKVPVENESGCGYNTGVYTEMNSCSVEFECDDLGTVFDYEQGFGKV